MATPEEIQKLLKDLDRVYKDLGTKNPFANFDASKVSDASSAVQILNSGLRDAKRELDDINGDLNETIIGFKKTVDEIKNTNSGLSLANKTFSGLSDLTRKLKSDQAGINELSGKELKNIQSQAKEKREDLKVSKDLLTSRIAELKELEKKEPLNAKQKKELTESISASKTVKNELREQDTLSTLINGKLNQRIAQETRIEKLLGLGGAAVAGTKAALDKLGFGGLANALGLDEVQEKMRKVADEIEKSEGYTGGFSDKMKVLKAGISEAGIQFNKVLKTRQQLLLF
jgi:DNA repair exonuclease SbcCD nuclease subunit